MAPTGEPADAAAIERARSLIRDATRIVALTGAGVSAESGVPTFRGAGALWQQYRPEDLATPQAFARDPRLVWEWYGWRRQTVAQCAPNAAHRALAEASRADPNVRVITQHVDGLHAAAGGPPPLELHGSLFRTRCTRCANRREDTDAIDASSLETLPHCERCKSLMRPDIVWFGEPLDAHVLGEASRLAAAADVCLVIGTSAVVYPAAGLAELTARSGGSVIELNVAETPLTDLAVVSLRGPAAVLAPQILGDHHPAS